MRRPTSLTLAFASARDQYVGGVPPDVAARTEPRLWEEDWRIMSLPGRLDIHRALVLDYRSHVALGAARYLLRTRGDLSRMKALPRMEAHILDDPHFLLETHPAECAALMSAFIRRVEGLR